MTLQIILIEKGVLVVSLNLCIIFQSKETQIIYFVSIN